MAAQPPQVVSYPAAHSISRGGFKPLVIVAHDTEGVDSRSTLRTGDDRSVSIHCLIQKFPRANGSTDVLPGMPPRSSGVVIYRMVEDERGANHAGYSSWKASDGKLYSPSGVNVNVISLGFEIECLGSKKSSDKYTEDQLLAAGYVINQWRAKYGPLPLVRHAEIDPTRRSDTYGLSTVELEKWANAAALVYQSPVSLPSTSHRIIGLPVYTRSDLSGGIVTHLPTNALVSIDVRAPAPGYAASAGHLSDGSGFIDLNGVGETQ